jgi:hypothetical protein
MHSDAYLRSMQSDKQLAPSGAARIGKPGGNRGLRFACLLTLLCSLALMRTRFAIAQGTSGNQQTYSLSGTVVNSATGEGVPRAMVRTNGNVQRNTWSDTDGHFQFDGLPPSQVTVTAQKPGFFNDQDANGPASNWITIGSNSGGITIKLIPQSAIYGRVTDSAGQPIEHMPLRLTARTVHEGRKRWEPRGMSETDEDGHYRFAGLMPGTYYLAAGPRQGELQLLAAGEKQKIGFPHLYYPGVPDFASAAPIQLASGAQSEADFSLGAVPVYQVSGVVSGHSPDQGVGFQVLTPSGDEVSVPTNFNMETGVFTLDDIPAGSYLLRALSQLSLQPLRAEARIAVASNMDGVHLALAPAVSIPIAVRLDAHASSTGVSTATNPQRPPVSVHLLPQDITVGELFSTSEPNGSGIMLQNVDFGTYTADIKPLPPWYVQAASYGQTNVLYDDIAILPGQSYPMEIVLRDDGATISGTLKSSAGTLQRINIVILAQPASKLGAHTLQGITDSFSLGGLAPGDYLVFAFDRIDGLEYSNPDVMDAYASQAAHVTLTAGQQAQVQVDVIHAGKKD